MISNCKARQQSDQMVCQCGLAWDVNDPDPPECRQGVVARQQLASIRTILQEPSRFASVQKRLLKLQEMPLNWLPSANIEQGLYTLRWKSIPEAVFVLVDDIRQGMIRGKRYQFFNERGRKHLEVERTDAPMFPFRYRYAEGDWSND